MTRRAMEDTRSNHTTIAVVAGVRKLSRWSPSAGTGHGRVMAVGAAERGRRFLLRSRSPSAAEADRAVATGSGTVEPRLSTGVPESAGLDAAAGFPNGCGSDSDCTNGINGRCDCTYTPADSGVFMGASTTSVQPTTIAAAARRAIAVRRTRAQRLWSGDTSARPRTPTPTRTAGMAGTAPQACWPPADTLAHLPATRRTTNASTTPIAGPAGGASVAPLARVSRTGFVRRSSASTVACIFKVSAGSRRTRTRGLVQKEAKSSSDHTRGRACLPRTIPPLPGLLRTSTSCGGAGAHDVVGRAVATLRCD